MRLVGPNCFGIAMPQIGLDATFGRHAPIAGIAGLAVQSGGVGIALTEHLSRLGIGVSSFVSMGDKYDVSGNDLLTWWEQDQQTKLAVLYLESFGNPRRFARTARRVGRVMPVLTVLADRSPGGQRAARSHAAAAAAPVVTRQALFSQAGVIVTASLGELVGVAAFLSCQPPPHGSRVAVVTNAGGAGMLAADACAEAGLLLAGLSEATLRRLRELLPDGATIANPVDTTAAVTQDTFRACLEAVAADGCVDAVISVAAPTAMADLGQAMIAAELTKPLSAVLLDQEPDVRLLARTGKEGSGAGRQLINAIPCYAYPEGAVRALGRAASYGIWRNRPPGHLPELPEVRTDDARVLVASFLAGLPEGGWLPAAAVRELLDCYHIPQVPTVLVQPMVRGGTEVLIGVARDPVFGPLIVFGTGGVAADVIGDHAARLNPLTDTDARELIASARVARLLDGCPGTPAADLDAVADVLLRVSRLADDLPEVAALDLNPVIVSADGCAAVDARIQLMSAQPHDPFLRQLR
jgi:acyl-CoA synthetase (NDP forming)